MVILCIIVSQLRLGLLRDLELQGFAFGFLHSHTTKNYVPLEDLKGITKKTDDFMGKVDQIVAKRSQFSTNFLDNYWEKTALGTFQCILL